MVGMRGLVLVAVAAAVAACGEPAGRPGGQASPPIAREPSLSPPARPPPGVSFSATVTGGSAGISIEYRVTNRGGQPIVVFNGVPAADSPNPQDAEAAAFYVIPTGGGVRLTKQVYGLPEGVAVAAPMALRGTVVAPGASTSELIETDSRLRARRPYQDILGYGDQQVPDPVRRIELCVGVAVAAEVTPRDATDPAHPVYGHDTATANKQYVFCSGPHELDT